MYQVEIKHTTRLPKNSQGRCPARIRSNPKRMTGSQMSPSSHMMHRE